MHGQEKLDLIKIEWGGGYRRPQLNVNFDHRPTKGKHSSVVDSFSNSENRIGGFPQSVG